MYFKFPESKLENHCVRSCLLCLDLLCEDFIHSYIARMTCFIWNRNCIITHFWSYNIETAGKQYFCNLDQKTACNVRHSSVNVEVLEYIPSRAVFVLVKERVSAFECSFFYRSLSISPGKKRGSLQIAIKVRHLKTPISSPHVSWDWFYGFEGLFLQSTLEKTFYCKTKDRAWSFK